MMDMRHKIDVLEPLNDPWGLFAVPQSKGKLLLAHVRPCLRYQ